MISWFTDENGFLRPGRIAAAIAVPIVALILFAMLVPVALVGAGEVGVKTTFGEISPEALQPGLHPRWPFAQKVTTFDVRTQRYDSQQSVAYTKDRQTITYHVSLNYNVDPARVVELFRDYGTSYASTIIHTAVEDLLKVEVAKYDSVEVVNNRDILRDDVKKALRERLGPSYIVVSQFNLVDDNFDDAYETAIRDKQVALERAKEAENKTKIVEQDAKQSILRAQAEAETSRLQAEALKTAGGEIVIEKIRAEAMLEAAKKWNGQLPTHMIPETSLPFVQVPL